MAGIKMSNTWHGSRALETFSLLHQDWMPGYWESLEDIQRGWRKDALYLAGVRFEHVTFGPEVFVKMTGPLGVSTSQIAITGELSCEINEHEIIALSGNHRFEHFMHHVVEMPDDESFMVVTSPWLPGALGTRWATHEVKHMLFYEGRWTSAVSSTKDDSYRIPGRPGAFYTMRRHIHLVGLHQTMGPDVEPIFLPEGDAAQEPKSYRIKPARVYIPEPPEP